MGAEAPGSLTAGLLPKMASGSVTPTDMRMYESADALRVENSLSCCRSGC